MNVLLVEVKPPGPVERFKETVWSVFGIFAWIGLGIELILVPLPLHLWPSIVDVQTRTNGHYWLGGAIVLSGAGILIGHLWGPTQRWAAFPWWICSILAVTLCGCFLASIWRGYVDDRTLWPEVLLAVGGWSVMGTMLVLSIVYGRKALWANPRM